MAFPSFDVGLNSPNIDSSITLETIFFGNYDTVNVEQRYTQQQLHCNSVKHLYR